MAESAKSYEVIITQPAENRYFNQILEYLKQHFSEERVDAISKKIFQEINSLQDQPLRGTNEPNLVLQEEKFKFILFRETRILEIKIIYWIDESTSKVFIIDLFPTKMNPKKLGYQR